MARGKSPNYELQRAGILQAAAHLFARRGFSGASMSELAAACGMSKPLLYHYYRDKQQILFDIANGHVERLIQIANEVRRRELEPQRHLRQLIAQFMKEYEHARSYHMVLVQDVKFLDPRQYDDIRKKQRRVVDEFARAIASLKPRMTRKQLRVPLAMILFGMINWTFTWLRAEGPLTYDDMARTVADVFLYGITSDSH